MKHRLKPTLTAEAHQELAVHTKTSKAGSIQIVPTWMPLWTLASFGVLSTAGRLALTWKNPRFADFRCQVAKGGSFCHVSSISETWSVHLFCQFVYQDISVYIFSGKAPRVPKTRCIPKVTKIQPAQAVCMLEAPQRNWIQTQGSHCSPHFGMPMFCRTCLSCLQLQSP